MTILAIALALTVVYEAVLIVGSWRYQSKQEARLWKQVEDLEADKRALTESLCRAQGKPFIPVHRGPTIPSDGWFDAKPEIKVVS